MKELTLQGKITKANKIVESSNRVKYFKDALAKLKKDYKSLHTSTIEIRITGAKTIWFDLSEEETIYILKKKLLAEEKYLNSL